MESDDQGRAICSICYEDLKPLVEDLQAISICGHVFHELCLQQWLEYCKSSKKCSCPVCKQVFPSKNVNRLYFQSIGDTTGPSLSPKKVESEAGLESSCDEVKRLEGKLLGLSSIAECLMKDNKQLKDELGHSEEELKKERKLKNEAVAQMASIQRILKTKSQELDVVKLESIRMKDRNTALVKELAALRLVSDLDLEDDTILKLASFGNEVNSKETIDILRRSLVIRNKYIFSVQIAFLFYHHSSCISQAPKFEEFFRSYKDLMAKCSLLGSRESQACRQLEKAQKKIATLKAKLQSFQALSSKNTSFRIDSEIDSVKEKSMKLDEQENIRLSEIMNNNGDDHYAEDIVRKSDFLITIRKEANPSFISTKSDASHYLGKWRKRSQSNDAVTSGDLVAVGSDGRGGRIKVLKPFPQFSSIDNVVAASTKRYKQGSKANNLQIEHFFGRKNK